MEDYDIGAAFAEIEEELIASMIRNLNHHRAEETKEGIEWSQWQVEQLRALEEYRRMNQHMFNPRFQSINDQIPTLIQIARQQGGMDQEIEILRAVQRGLHTKKASDAAMGRFFTVNDRKLGALVKATRQDLTKAEHAVLRMANDKYRKTIFNAQVYANAGGTTYEKAVDMATRDMLRAGLNCVEYKNGARHTLSDYADMCLKTATKRAYLTGEGEKRKEWGIATVIMNKRGNPCPLCAPWCGKVLIDDVWSGGKPDGKHPLMSTAIEKGLYHPRCKDVHTTYFPGISTADDPYDRKEQEELVEDYNQEQRQSYYERQAEQCERIGKYSLDPDNQRMYKERAEQAKENCINNISGGKGQEDLDSINKDATEKLLKAYEDNRVYNKLNLISAEELKTSKLNPVTADYTGISAESARKFNDAIEGLSDEYYTGLTKIRVDDPKKAFGSASFATTVHNNAVGQKELIINPQKMKDYGKMVDRIQELSKMGHCVKVSAENAGKYIPTHEFAHTLIDMDSPLKNYIGMDTKKPRRVRKQIKALFESYKEEIKGIEDKIAQIKKEKVFTDTSASAEDLFDAFKRLEVAQKELSSVKISRYSMENADEFMAEAFTQAKIGEQRSNYTQKVMDVLDGAFSKKTIENHEGNGIISLSNIEVRKRYIEAVSSIKNNINPSLPIEERARLAFEERNRIRSEAREMMEDQETKMLLERERPNKTFEELVKSKMKRKNMTRDEAVKDIYETATKTNEDVNKELGLGGD